MRRGLVVGKFMPLHRGHQLLIETALAQVDELTVVVYDTPVSGVSMPVEKRANWVAQLYPQVHNVVAQRDPLYDDYDVNRDHDGGKYSKIYAEDVEYLGPFTHVFSSEGYGEPYADAINTQQVEEAYRTRRPKDYPTKPMVENVIVDAARTLVPISGTQFRSDMFKYRAFVDPLVYRSLIQKIVFVGTESTGKSTLAKRMAQEYNTRHTEEYGRTLWTDYLNNGIKPTFHDLLTVGETQYQQEQAAMLHSNRFLFCDTNAWTTMHWSEMYHGNVDQRLRDLADRTMDDYIWIMCDNDFDWVDDGTRELKDGKAREFQKKLYADLCERLGDIPHTVWGSLEDRVEQTKRIVDIL